MFNKRLKNRLKIQRDSGLYRDPAEISERRGKYIEINNKRILNFASNDYLGIGTSAGFRKMVSKNFKKYGTSSSSSRLIAGNYSAILEAERAYAGYFGYDEALFFPSGYQANIGLLSALFSKGDLLVFDKHVHASCVRGMELGNATFKGYNHNSMPHLEKRLGKSGNDCTAVVTESLFSMDGDILNLEDFYQLKEKYNFLSIIDEAHAFGALGEKGRGIARSAADIAVGTFGKALGFFGAFLLLPAGFRDYLVNFSSPFIYSTALPQAHAASAIDLLTIIDKSDEQREALKERSASIKKRLLCEGFRIRGDAHIVILEIGDELRAVALANTLLRKGIYVMPARYPTVPAGKAIIRIGMTALHTEKDIASLLKALAEAAEADPER